MGLAGLRGRRRPHPATVEDHHWQNHRRQTGISTPRIAWDDDIGPFKNL